MNSSWRVGVAMFVILVARLSATYNPLEEMIGGLDSKSSREEEAALKRAVEKTPESEDAWAAWVAYSFTHDEPEATVAISDRALRALPHSPVLWRLRADVFLSDAQSGIKGVSRPGVYRGRRNPPAMEDAAFRRMSLEKALECLNHVLEAKPGVPEASLRKMDVLMGLERWAEAEEFARKQISLTTPPEITARCAFSMIKLNRASEAVTFLEGALRKEPHSAPLYFVMSDACEALKDEPGAAAAKAKGAFYGRLLPDSRLEYSDSRAEALKRLFAESGKGDALFGPKLDKEAITAEITRLEALNDDESLELLAALAWSHVAHGALEDRVYDLLAKRKDIGRLVRLLTHSRSTCTKGSCLSKLVALGAPGTFEQLADSLEGDGGMFPIGVVGLLDELGDPRAGPLLIKYSSNPRAHYLAESLVVLGRFDSPAVRAHLERFLNDKENRSAAVAGLYRLTKDEKYLKLLAKYFKKDDVWDLRPAVLYLRELDNPKAKELVALFDKRDNAKK